METRKENKNEKEARKTNYPNGLEHQLLNIATNVNPLPTRIPIIDDARMKAHTHIQPAYSTLNQPNNPFYSFFPLFLVRRFVSPLVPPS